MATISEAMAMALQHCQAGRFQVAEQIFRLVLQAEPNHVAAHNNLGNALQEQGRLEEAVLFYQRAVQLDPGFAMPYSNLGGVLYAQGKLNEAVRCYQRALELTPELADAHNNLGVAFQDQGRLDEAVACYRSALELRPDSCTSHSDYLYCQQYLPGATLAQLASIHQQWDQRHAAPFRAAWRRHENSADPQRRLRLGFVSVGFRRHPAGYLFVRALESLDAKDCETICYANHGGPDDAITARLKKAAGTWRTALGLSDEALAGQIRSDGVDILFDLDGHHGGNRLLVFARRPAPIQITWLAYVGTTGLAAMDYILADHYHIPEQSERYYREKVLRMPSGYICYDPPPDAPPVASLPALGRGYVTFGSFNRPPKITPAVVATWADILRRVPGARLILLHTAFGDSGTTRHYERLFSAQGVPPNRFDLLGPKPYQELLDYYRNIDIALDPFPYSGGLVTCDALWMGVPVVTCPGETFASRHSLSHLSNVGLTETIAGSVDEYVELAVSLAGDLPRLAALRGGLRERMAASPLCDGRRFAADLTPLLRAVWQQWINHGQK